MSRPLCIVLSLVSCIGCADEASSPPVTIPDTGNFVDMGSVEMGGADMQIIRDVGRDASQESMPDQSERDEVMLPEEMGEEVDSGDMNEEQGCSTSGSPFFTFSDDGGATLAPRLGDLSAFHRTEGLAALPGRPGVWIGASNPFDGSGDTDLYLSTDDGCTFTEVADLQSLRGPAKVVIGANADTTAWVWERNRSFVYKVIVAPDDSVTTTEVDLSGHTLATGLGVDPEDQDRIRFTTRLGQLVENRDGGDTFLFAGRQAYLSGGRTTARPRHRL